MVLQRFKGDRLALAFVSIALLIALAPATAQASTLSATTLELADSGNTLSAQAVKVVKKTLKPIYYSDSVTTQKNKATLIKKKGTYALTLKNGMGIVRFKSPKTKTYAFTFSKLKSGETDELVCVAGFAKVSGTDYTYKTIKTKEGKRPRAPFVSSSLANGKSVVFDGYSYKRLGTRTAKLKVKKGSSIYIALQARDLDDDEIRSTLRLKIA